MAEESNEKLNIRLHVYDKEIHVAIKRDEEELYRDAAKLITERYGVYNQMFKVSKSDHEIALMTLVEIALRLQRELHRNDTQPYDDILSQLTSEIEEAMK
ncbi:MAG: cell division protein ZapA [Prevotella sp.]|nr:cell division protein ZapA [Prevotella sp.]